MPEAVANAAIQANANRIARLLDEAGLERGGVVALLCPNVPEFLYCFRALTFSGRILTPIGCHLPTDDARYIVENSGATALIAHAEHSDTAQTLAAGLAGEHCFSIGGAIPGFRPLEDYRHHDPAPLEQPAAGDVMLYTSGTTGRPKGVHRGLKPRGEPPGVVGAAGRAMMQHFLGEQADGRHLAVAPLYHAAAITYAEGAALCGADVVVLRRFDPEEFLHTVEKYRIVSTFLVPTHFVRLLRLPEAVRRRYDLSSLQLVCHGAAPVSIPVKRAMIEWLGPILFESYGGTEGGGIHISSQEWLEHPGSVGRPAPELRVRILGADGREQPPGEAGLIYMSNPNGFEYLGDPEKTADAWRDDQFTLGDIGYLDHAGYLYLCDRRSDLIISGGVNVYPAAVEAVLLQHPAIEDCCVIGLPDEEWGEQVCAVIKPRQDLSAALREEIEAHCRQELAPAQVPRSLIVDSTLQRTPTGKLSRRQLREKHRRGAATP